MTDLFLAIEGGGSNTRVLLMDARENILTLERGGPSSPLYIDVDEFRVMLTGLLAKVQHHIEAQPNPVLQAIGLAGPLDRTLLYEILAEIFPDVPVHLSSEGEIALALYQLEAGVSVVAGTGSSCRARNETGAWCSGGGFGPQFGDEGSAYWIGKTAISKLARPDGNSFYENPLARAFRRCYHADNLWDLLKLRDRNGHLPVHKVAQFTPYVLEAAREGDPLALDTLADAGRALARLVLDTTRRCNFTTQPIPLAPSGGVFHCGDFVLEPMKQTLRAGKITFKHYPPVTDPCWGLMAWLLKQYGHRATQCQAHHGVSGQS